MHAGLLDLLRALRGYAARGGVLRVVLGVAQLLLFLPPARAPEEAGRERGREQQVARAERKVQARPQLVADVRARDDKHGPQDAVLAGRVAARIPAQQAAHEAVRAQRRRQRERRQREPDDLLSALKGPSSAADTLATHDDRRRVRQVRVDGVERGRVGHEERVAGVGHGGWMER